MPEKMKLESIRSLRRSPTREQNQKEKLTVHVEALYVDEPSKKTTNRERRSRIRGRTLEKTPNRERRSRIRERNHEKTPKP